MIGSKLLATASSLRIAIGIACITTFFELGLKLRSRWEVNAEHVNGFCMFCDIFRFLRQPGANARSLNLIYLSFSGGAWLFLSHSRDWFLMPQGGIARPNPFTFCFCFSLPLPFPSLIAVKQGARKASVVIKKKSWHASIMS